MTSSVLVDNMEAVFLVLLDLSSAFDTIDHNVLISFLNQELGIEATALDTALDCLH
jgi:hypothetical protein